MKIRQMTKLYVKYSFVSRIISGLECDAVVHLRNGSYGLIEIKLGGDTLISEGAANLNSLAEKIDTTKRLIIWTDFLHSKGTRIWLLSVRRTRSRNLLCERACGVEDSVIV